MGHRRTAQVSVQTTDANLGHRVFSLGPLHAARDDDLLGDFLVDGSDVIVARAVMKRAHYGRVAAGEHPQDASFGAAVVAFAAQLHQHLIAVHGRSDLLRMNVDVAGRQSGADRHWGSRSRSRRDAWSSGPRPGSALRRHVPLRCSGRARSRSGGHFSREPASVRRAAAAPGRVNSSREPIACSQQNDGAGVQYAARSPDR